MFSILHLPKSMNLFCLSSIIRDISVVLNKGLVSDDAGTADMEWSLRIIESEERRGMSAISFDFLISFRING